MTTLQQPDPSTVPAFEEDLRGDGFTPERTLVAGRALRLAGTDSTGPLPVSTVADARAALAWMWDGWETIAEVPYSGGTGVVCRHLSTGEYGAYFYTVEQQRQPSSTTDVPWKLGAARSLGYAWSYIAMNAVCGPSLVDVLTGLGQRYERSRSMPVFTVGAGRAVLAIDSDDRRSAEVLTALTHEPFMKAVAQSTKTDALHAVGEEAKAVLRQVGHQRGAGCSLCQVVGEIYDRDRNLGRNPEWDEARDRLYRDWWDEDARQLREGWDEAFVAGLRAETHLRMTAPSPSYGHRSLLTGMPAEVTETLLGLWEDSTKTAKQALKEAFALVADHHTEPVEVLGLSQGRGRARQGEAHWRVLLAAVRIGDQIYVTSVQASVHDWAETTACWRAGTLTSALHELRSWDTTSRYDTPLWHIATRSHWRKFSTAIQNTLTAG